MKGLVFMGKARQVFSLIRFLASVKGYKKLEDL